MNIISNQISSLLGLTDTQTPRPRRAYTCSICNTEGHNAMSCSDPCINERYITIHLLLSNYPRIMVSYDAIQNIRREITSCNHTHGFWRRVWLKLRELITILDTGEINRDNLEFILREPSQLVNAQHYKERIYQLIATVEHDVVNAQNNGVTIDEYLGLNNEGVMVGLAGETITNVMVERYVARQKPAYSQQSTQICFKMDFDTSKYYEQTNCPICFDPILTDKCIALNCSHIFCTECAPSILKTTKCPICRKSIEQIRFTSNINPDAFNAIQIAISALESR